MPKRVHALLFSYRDPRPRYAHVRGEPLEGSPGGAEGGRHHAGGGGAHDGNLNYWDVHLKSISPNWALEFRFN